MRRLTHDEGTIIHWAGGRGLYPVRQGEAGPLGFSRYGQDETGQRRIGWGEFMNVRRKLDLALTYDDAGEDWSLVPRRGARHRDPAAAA